MRVASYFSLVKFAHTVFALPFACIGFTLGILQPGMEFSVSLLLKVLVCMVTARNAAMGFNRYLDRRIDAMNPRTASREIPSGVLSPRNVLVFVAVNCLLFIATCSFINRLCLMLSPVVLTVLLGYSSLKRFTALCHFGLGLSLSLAPAGAYMAVTGEIAPAPLIVSLIVLLWSGAFDILYALADEDFDKRYGIRSIPARLGRKKAMILSGFLHALVVPLTGVLYFYIFKDPEISFSESGGVHWIYITGALLFSGLLAYQHCIISPSDLRRLDAAFFTTNGLASVIFAVFTVWSLLAG